MPFKNSFLAALVLVSAALAQLPKPVIDPSVNGGGQVRDRIDQDLFSNLPSQQATWDRWGDGYLPLWCHDVALGKGHNLADVSAYNVKYGDCDKTWTLCHHNNAGYSFDTMVDLFGKIPVAARSATVHPLALLGGGGCSGFTLDKYFAMEGAGCGSAISPWIHENMHTNDQNNFNGKGQLNNGYSSQSEWIDALNSDSAVVSDYANTNNAESLAETAFAAVYDQVVPGGFGQLSSTDPIRNQLDTLKRYASQITPGGTCPFRLPDQAPVPNSQARTRHRRRQAYRMERFF